jgi:predicted PurR-regulated permease PerM
MEIFLSTALLIVFTTSIIVNYRLIKELENVKLVCNKSLRYYENKLNQLENETLEDFTKEEVDQMERDFNNKINNYNDNSFKTTLTYVYGNNEVISVHNKDT